MASHTSATGDIAFGFHVRCMGCGEGGFVREGTSLRDGSAVVTSDRAVKWFREQGWGWRRRVGYWCSPECETIVCEAHAEKVA